MPRLVLMDDAGGELWSQHVSPESTRAFATWLARHLPALRVLASMRKAVRELAEHAQALARVAPRARGRR